MSACGRSGCVVSLSARQDSVPRLNALLPCCVLTCQIRDREGLDRAIFAAKESTEHASNLCSRVAQAMLAKGPVNKLGPLLKEAKAGIDTAQVRVAAKCVALRIVPPPCVRGQCVAQCACVAWNMGG